MKLLREIYNLIEESNRMVVQTNDKELDAKNLTNELQEIHDSVGIMNYTTKDNQADSKIRYIRASLVQPGVFEINLELYPNRDELTPFEYNEVLLAIDNHLKTRDETGASFANQQMKRKLSQQKTNRTLH